MTKLVCIALLCILIPITHISHHFLIKENNKVTLEKVKFNLPSPEITKVASFGYANLIADIVWLQFIQYMGGLSLGNYKYLPEMNSLLDTITTLDPNFKDAYTVGAYALADNYDFDKAIYILNKGTKNLPNEWYFSYQAGFMYYIYKKNKSEATRYFEKSIKVKNAPPILAKLIASLKSELKSDDYDFQIELWKTVQENAKKHDDKRNIEKSSKKIIELTIKKDLKYLQAIIDKYNEDDTNSDIVYPDNSDNKLPDSNKKNKVIQKEPIKTLKDLIDFKLLENLPFDPFKRPYLFDAETQKVASFDLPWKE